MRSLGWLFVVLAALLPACGSQSEATPLPTLTLVPPTETSIPTIPPATSTPDSALTSPEMLLTAGAPPTTGSSISPTGDAVAAELVMLASQQVAQQLGITVRRVRLVSVTQTRWADSSLGCPRPDQVYLPVEVDGYRIVLEAGDNRYIYHTDFDRVIPCTTEPETSTATS
jgi:hypothetical protein